MEWLSENWVFVLFAGAMVAMHAFGHGGHGGHGGHRGHGKEDVGGQDDSKPASKDRVQQISKTGSGHQH